MKIKTFLLLALLPALLLLSSCPDCDRAVLDALDKPRMESSSDLFLEHGNYWTAVSCRPDCPPEADIEKAVKALQCTFKDGLSEQEAWKSLHKYRLVFSSTPFGAPGTKGTHTPDLNLIVIYYPHPCEDGRPQGLCGGVFDWEVGNAMMEIVLAKQGVWGASEQQKYDYRKQHDLWTGCQSVWNP
jgi:hypothetical protein